MMKEIGLYQTDCTFTVEEYPTSKDCWYTHHFSAYGREGGAVYYFLNHPVYAEELKAHSFPEYRLLIHVNNKGFEIPYGVIMQLDGVWNAYLADKGHYYIKNWTFKSIDEAVDYFEGYVKSNEQLNDMAQRFINRNGQI